LAESEGRNCPRHRTAVIAIRSDNRTVVDRMILIIGKTKDKLRLYLEYQVSGMELV
jgi:hypothetical protein